jgi:hypothetical protein
METIRKNLTEAEIKARSRARMLDAARLYAKADRTDPFAMMRMVTHIDNGVASVHRSANAEYELSPGPAFYNAEQHREQYQVFQHGSTTPVTVDRVVYRNVVRP